TSSYAAFERPCMRLPAIAPSGDRGRRPLRQALGERFRARGGWRLEWRACTREGRERRIVDRCDPANHARGDEGTLALRFRLALLVSPSQALRLDRGSAGNRAGP